MRLSSLPDLFIFGIFACIIWPSSLFATINYVADSADTEIDHLQTETCSTNMGFGTTISVGRVGTKPTTTNRALLHFDLTFIPRLSTINSAELQLYVEAYTATPSLPTFPLTIGRLTNTLWTEPTATWTSYRCGPATASSGEWCQQGADFSSGDQATWQPGSTAVGFQRINISTLVRQAVGAQGVPTSATLHTGGQLHLLLRAGDDDSISAEHHIRFRTRDHPFWISFVPLLVIDWTPGPSPMTSPWIAFRDESSTRLDLAGIVPASDTKEKDMTAVDLDDDGDLDIVVVRKTPGTSVGAQSNVYRWESEW